MLNKDNDIEAKKAVYLTQLINKMQAEQQVTILNASIATETDNESDKIIYPDMLQAIVKNNTSKTIKDMKVSWLGYDSNSYPLKIKGEFDTNEDDSYEFVGKAEDINLVPNATYGDKTGWKLNENHGLSKVIACVKSVTYYDGTTWDNPYYKYWIEQYKEKPIK